MIGKPCAGKSHARFDEGELEIGPSPLRQLSTLPKGTDILADNNSRLRSSARVAGGAC